MRVKLIVSGLFLLLSASTASAQTSIWLQKGTSGYGGALQLQTGNDTTMIGLLGGYSYRGFLDVNLGLRRYSFENSEIDAYGLAPGVQFHPLKQDADTPVSVGLGTSFEKVFFSGDGSDGLDGWNLTFSGNVYRFFRLGKNVGVIPSGGLSFTHSSTTRSGSTDSEDNIAFDLVGNFAIQSGTTIWGIAPVLSIGEDVFFGVNISVVLSQPPKS
jgi:hypothetical protein